MTVYRSILRNIAQSQIVLRIARGLMWTVVASLISRGLLLLASIFVTRELGKNGYGEYGVIQSSIAMFSVLAGFGLGVTATKYVAECRNDDPVRAGEIATLSMQVAIASGALLSIIVFLWAPWLASYSLNAPQLSGFLKISALVIFFSAINGAQIGILAGLEEFKSIAKINFAVGVCSFGSLTSLVYLNGLSGAIWALVVNAVISTVLNGLFLKEKLLIGNIRINLFSFDLKCENLTVLWKFSVPAAFSGVLVGPVNWLCHALLVNQQGGYSEMGIYSLALQWNAVILFFPGLIGQVILPFLANLNYQNKEDGQYERLVLMNVLVNGIVASVIVAPIIVFAPHIISLYGPGFDKGIEVLRITATTAVLMAINSVVGSALASKGRMWGAFLLNLVWAITILASSKVSASLSLGAIGLAYSTLFAYAMHTLWQYIYYKKCL